ncbi:DMT family transporter [Coxiella-like endosymbiont]|uniref:DMT family transporter n=1 Tax=Coxiella-like endosymbiont TaxID=1592897 RepID=UPI00272A0088|nr:DMT family transporter [Coxiella-like endosymbiont]
MYLHRLVEIFRRSLVPIIGPVYYACHIVALQAFSKKLKPEDTTLDLNYQIAFSLFLPLLTSSYKNTGAIFSWSVVISILFCSIFATCLVFYLQLRYQRYVSVGKAALIYNFEPVFDRVFSYLPNREKIYLNNIRSLLILISFLLFELISFKKPQTSSNIDD